MSGHVEFWKPAIRQIVKESIFATEGFLWNVIQGSEWLSKTQVEKAFNHVMENLVETNMELLKRYKHLAILRHVIYFPTGSSNPICPMQNNEFLAIQFSEEETNLLETHCDSRLSW